MFRNYCLSNAFAVAFLATASSVSAQYNVVGPDEQSQGFVSMFDGTRESFNASFVDYVGGDSLNTTLDSSWGVFADSAAITNTAQGSDLRSAIKYKDFDFRFDYMHPGDGGLVYRFNLSGGFPWQSGVEWSIIDNADSCDQCAGAAHDIYGPIPNVYKPFAGGEWNSVRLVVVGDSVEHWLNGVQVVGYKYHSADFWSHFDASKWAASGVTMKVPGMRDSGYIDEGFIGFQGRAAAGFLLRNLRINGTTPKLGTPDPVVIRPPAGKHALRKAGNSLRRFTIPLRDGGSATLDGRRIRVPLQP